jgi:hypothetical protein
MRVVDKPRRQNSALLMNHDDQLPPLPRIEDLHAGTDRWPVEVDEKGIRCRDIDFVEFNDLSEGFSLAASVVSTHRVQRVGEA